jgi:PST family polysaccharide transporter
VQLLLGPGWDTAALLFSLLAIAGFAQAIGRLRTWLYISLGHSHRQFVYDLVARPIVIAGYFFGIWWGGLPGLVITYGVLSLILLVPGFAFAMRGTFVRPGDVFAPIVRPFLMALVALAAAYAVSHLLASTFAIVQVLAGALAALVVAAPLFLIPGYRRDLAQMMDFVKKVRKPNARAAADSDGVSTPETDAATAEEVAAELATVESFSEMVTDEPRPDEDELVRTEEVVRRSRRERQTSAAAGPGHDDRP